MIPPLIFMIYAQARVNSAFNKYSKVANSQRITGSEAAEKLLRSNGLGNVKVEAGEKQAGRPLRPEQKSVASFPGGG